MCLPYHTDLLAASQLPPTGFGQKTPKKFVIDAGKSVETLILGTVLTDQAGLILEVGKDSFASSTASAPLMSKRLLDPKTCCRIY